MDPFKASSLDSRTVEELCDMARDPVAAPQLIEFFGDEQYQQLRSALQGGPRAPSRNMPGTVVLLHGIMGSQIGKALRREWDIVWLNPLAVRDGNFSLLKLGSGRSRYGARGLLPLFYALLWARLKFWYRYSVVEFAYDWRVGIHESGDELVEFIEQETSGPVYIVAHSMGGLVARAALPTLSSRVQRIVQLATPNYGSFSPVVTMRGQNEFVNKILAFDTGTSVTDLLSNTVSTFQGLYELMPSPARFSAVKLFDPSVWPAAPSINPAALLKARSAIEQLPGPDQRFVLIAGNNQETVTGMTVDSSGEFRFTTTTSGDGTVPLDFARFDSSAQIPTYLADVTHNGIIADGNVSAAVDDILRNGQTARLPRDSGSPTDRRSVSGRPLDATRARDPLAGRDVNSLAGAEIRAIQREVLGPLKPNTPPQAEAGVLAAAVGDDFQSRFKDIVVSRRRRRVRIVLAKGDITKVPVHAHVIGVFEGVTPSGPAHAFDSLLAGAISDLSERKIFSGMRGKIYFMPTYKTQIPGDVLTIAGLGSFAEFQSDVIVSTAQQVIQSLLRIRVNELATVIFGGASSGDIRNCLVAMLKGFIKGLMENDQNFEFQRVIICEKDDQKFAELQTELYQLASSSLFDGTEVEFDVIRVPDMELSRRSSQLPPSSEEPVYVISHLSYDLSANDQKGTYRHDISVLPPDSGTSLPQYAVQFTKAELDGYIQAVQRGAPAKLDEFGAGLAKLILPPELISSFKDVIASRGLQLIHDALSTRIPWEAVKFDDVWPALMKGVSRKYQGNQAAAMFSRAQQHNQLLRILLVYNPTEDLDGAEKEGERIQKVVGKWSGQMRMKPLHGREATREAILNELTNADYDILHYAGHAGYVADNPAQSGLVCSGSEILTGRDLAPLGSQLAPVIILNACESGRVRKLPPVSTENVPASVAEAILNAGIMCFIATYWPVSDTGADIFADRFYETVLSGLQAGGTTHSVGDAVLAARQALKAKDEGDWANYMLYGDPRFILKKSTRQ